MKAVTLVLLAVIASFGFVQSSLALDAAKAKEKVLYSFCSQQNCTDGRYPVGTVVDINGTLYGTTSGGGANCQSDGGCGTLFSINPKTGKEKVLYSFCGQQNCADGDFPGGLTEVNGKLYGTTAAGGSGGASCTLKGGCGAVYAFDPKTASETVLYSFCSEQACADGAAPWNINLIDVKGVLYGTTDGGGENCQAGGGCGTVFSLDVKTGTENMLYSFCAQQNCTDGAAPLAGLVDVKGMLYGTTSLGGVCQETFCGTVFALDVKTGAESVLHSFCSQENCADGSQPFAGLINVKGTLYGTTFSGGAAATYGGTVFAIDPSTGAETVIYSFCSQQNCADGCSPWDAPTYVHGKLYGTTSNCGTSNWGTAFAIKPATGTEKVLHTFTNDPDGGDAFAGLTEVNGTFYGTTEQGGTNCAQNSGCGTVFVLTP